MWTIVAFGVATKIKAFGLSTVDMKEATAFLDLHLGLAFTGML